MGNRGASVPMGQVRETMIAFTDSVLKTHYSNNLESGAPQASMTVGRFSFLGLQSDCKRTMYQSAGDLDEREIEAIPFLWLHPI